MKRIQPLLETLLTQITQASQLTPAQSEQLAPIKQILLAGVHDRARTKQEIYQQCVKFIGEKVGLKRYQVQPVLRALYQGFFGRFQLVRECGALERDREGKGKGNTGKAEDNFVFANIQMPYVVPPLAQAVEIPIKRGIQLDPLYLE